MRLNHARIERDLHDWLSLLTEHIGPPQFTQVEGGYSYRFAKNGAREAILMRLARIVSSLNATSLLHHEGFLQEQIVLERTLDEFTEDVEFLSFGLINGELTDLHERFLTGFFAELPSSDLMTRTKMKGRAMPPRDKIRTYLAEQTKEAVDKNNAINSSAAVNQTYSGYVHGYHPQLMELAQEGRPYWAVRGDSNELVSVDHAFDLDNYWYRGVVAFTVAAKAFSNDAIFQKSFSVFKYLDLIMLNSNAD